MDANTKELIGKMDAAFQAVKENLEPLKLALQQRGLEKQEEQVQEFIAEGIPLAQKQLRVMEEQIIAAKLSEAPTFPITYQRTLPAPARYRSALDLTVQYVKALQEDISGLRNQLAEAALLERDDAPATSQDDTIVPLRETLNVVDTHIGELSKVANRMTKHLSRKYKVEHGK